MNDWKFGEMVEETEWSPRVMFVVSADTGSGFKAFDFHSPSLPLHGWWAWEYGGESKQRVKESE